MSDSKLWRVGKLCSMGPLLLAPRERGSSVFRHCKSEQYCWQLWSRRWDSTGCECHVVTCVSVARCLPPEVITDHNPLRRSRGPVLVQHVWQYSYPFQVLHCVATCFSEWRNIHCSMSLRLTRCTIFPQQTGKTQTMFCVVGCGQFMRCHCLQHLRLRRHKGGGPGLSAMACFARSTMPGCTCRTFTFSPLSTASNPGTFSQPTIT